MKPRSALRCIGSAHELIDMVSDHLAARRLRWIVRMMDAPERRVLALGVGEKLGTRREVQIYDEIIDYLRSVYGCDREGAERREEAPGCAEAAAAAWRVADRGESADGREGRRTPPDRGLAGEGGLRREEARMGIAGPWFVTPHAVRQYQVRARRWGSYEQALGELVRLARTAHRVKRLPTGAVLYRTGRPERWRFLVREDGDGLPQLVTVLKGSDRTRK